MSVYDTASATPGRLAEQLHAMRDAGHRASAATAELSATMHRLADLPHPVDTEQEKP